MSPPNLQQSIEMAKEHTLTASEAQLKYEKLTLELAEVKKAKLRLNPHKERKRLAEPINHAETPKKSFHHPKLEYIYGEIVCSPYLTPPLENYPKEVFSVIHDLRDLKRHGVKSISRLPKERQPYDVKKTRGKFIKDVINYEVSFLPKGYDEKKAKAEKILEAEREWEKQQMDDLKEILGENQEIPKALRPTTSEGGRPKSQILQANIARGGPDRFNQDARDLRKKKMSMTKEQRRKEMTDACLEAEEQARQQRLTEQHKKDYARELAEVGELRAVAVDDDIHRFKDKAYRIKRSVVTRAERVSSPVKLIQRRMQEFDDDDFQKRGRCRSPTRLRPPTDEPLKFNKSTGLLMTRISKDNVSTPKIKAPAPKTTKSKSQNKNMDSLPPAKPSASMQYNEDTAAAEEQPESSAPSFPIITMTGDDDGDYEHDNDFEAGKTLSIEEPDLSGFDGNDGEYGSVEDEFEEEIVERPETTTNKGEGGGRGGRATAKQSNVADIDKHIDAEEDFPNYEAAEFENDDDIEAPASVESVTSLPTVAAPPPIESKEADAKDAKDGSDSANASIPDYGNDDFDEHSAVTSESKGGNDHDVDAKMIVGLDSKSVVSAGDASIASVDDEVPEIADC